MVRIAVSINSCSLVLPSLYHSSDFVGNVELTSDKTRQLTCPGDLVIFTCRVFVSSSLEWRSPLITEQILYTASDRPPRNLSRGSFTASLISVSGTPLEANFTSTLQVTASRTFMRNATVMCLSSTPESETDNFTAAGKQQQTNNKYSRKSLIRTHWDWRLFG